MIARALDDWDELSVGSSWWDIGRTLGTTLVPRPRTRRDRTRHVFLE